MEVRIESLVKRVNEHFTLDVGHAVFPSGQITGLAGDNGRGKTTLLKIIAGVDREFSGKVAYGGKSLREVRRDITMTFQTPMLLNRSVLANVEYPVKIRGASSAEARKRAEELLEALGISHLARKNATRLSGGESQRVALARAISFKPKLLLLDELFSSIDVNTMEDVERCVVDYNRETSATVIVVSHNRGQTERLCGSVIEL